MRLVALTLVAVSVAALAAGFSSRKAAPNPETSSVYLDHALTIMRTNALYAPAVDWPVVTAEAHKMAAKATIASGTYAAIRYAIRALNGAGDLHAKFYIAPEWKQLAQTTNTGWSSPPPTVSLIKGHLGSITLPGILTSLTSSNSRRYARSALTRISSLQTKAHPCGWIVDLRHDEGGDMYPMLLSVGPILGQGHLIGFTGSKGFRYYVSYRSNTLSGGPYFVDHAPLKVADFTPSPAVAVLTSQNTASSGEVVTVAFRGRPNTRSFGAPTTGATNTPAPYHLADGAVLLFAVDYCTDRDGTVYKQPIKPDVSFAYTASASSVKRAAEQWLLSTPACSRTH